MAVPPAPSVKPPVPCGGLAPSVPAHAVSFPFGDEDQIPVCQRHKHTRGMGSGVPRSPPLFLGIFKSSGHLSTATASLESSGPSRRGPGSPSDTSKRRQEVVSSICDVCGPSWRRPLHVTWRRRHRGRSPHAPCSALGMLSNLPSNSSEGTF